MQKVQAFVDGIKDFETKRAIMVSPKESFAETFGYALTQETATIACTPQWKIRRAALEHDDISDVLCQAVKTALEPKGKIEKRTTGKCFFCGTPGHFSRDCRQRQKWLKEKRYADDTGPKSAQVSVCEFCEKRGHLARECKYRYQWLQENGENLMMEEGENNALN